IGTRPDAIYVEHMDGNITPMDRVFFHIVLHDISKETLNVDWVRLDLTNSTGVVLSVQYSGMALMNLFDSSIDRHRIEPTPKNTLEIQPDQRKSISDVFFDCPSGFIGEVLIVEAQYRIGTKVQSVKSSTLLKRTPSFSGRLPFDGVWYVLNEHGYLDLHKRYLAEAFAYDFIQIGANGKSYQQEGRRNSDYYAYGKKVLAAKDGTVVFVRTDVYENDPGRTNLNNPGGNVVIIDHGDNQFGYYAHLRPNSTTLKPGAKVKAGDPIGEAGNSGESYEPGLHFHVMNNADSNLGDGIPVVFDSWKAESFSAFPTERERGLIPKGEFIQP
ncbi:MAG TPA: M23 family metallopeptidase, partial [Terriglobia bacterium]|nr:M23 family metallopeptidase [Terriglobia bacterium]